MAENEKVLTDKTGQELIKATKDLSKSIQDLSKVQTKAISTTATASDIMKKTGSKENQKTDAPSIGVDNTKRYVDKDPTKNYLKNSLIALKDILKVNKEMLANSMNKFGKGLGSLLALGGLLGYLFTGKVELLYATAKGFIKGFIMPITKIIDLFVMNFAKNMLANGARIFAGFKNIFADVGKAFVGAFRGMSKQILKKTGITGLAKTRIGKKVVEKGVGLGKKVVEKGVGLGKKVVEKGVGAISKIIPKSLGKKVAQEGAETVGKVVAKEGLETLGKTAGTKGASALLKSGAKLGLKGLAKIPFLGVILGPVVGIVFAMQRWKKGDKIGALMELGSGLASMIPFVGIPISLAIDVYMAFRDVKNSPEDIKKQNDDAGKTIKSKSFGKNALLKGLARIPIFGAIIRPMLAMQKWKKGDKVGALLEVGAGLAGLVPGIGTAVSIALDAYSVFRDSKIENQTATQENPVAGSNIDQSAKKATSNTWSMFPTQANAPSVNQSSTKLGSYDAIQNRWSGKGDADIDMLQSPMKQEMEKEQEKKVNVKPKSYTVPPTPESYMTKVKETTKKVAKNVSDLIKNPFIFRKGAKLKGTLPKVEQNFTSMAQEYVADKKPENLPFQIPINSGYRSYEEQKALYLQYKAQGKEKYAANPDDPKTGLPKKNPTPHIAGKAVDVDSNVADYLEQTGKLEQYGFYRPLMQRAGQPPNILEPWHIQAKPSLIGDADETSVSNSEAINKQSYATNMDKMDSSNDKLHSAIRELIEVTKESNAKLQKTLGSQKITNKQTLSVNSLG